MKRISIMMLWIAILFCCFFSTVNGQQLEEDQGDLVIYFTNDTHGRVLPDLNEPSWGYSRIAQMKKNSLKKTNSVLLFSAGDEIEGEPIVNLDEGENAINFMNLTGYDAMTLGNHEFNYGADRLMQLRDKAKFDMLSANITRTVGGELIFDAGKVFHEPNGMNVCVFGLTTPETKTASKPTDVTGIDFGAGENLYKAAQDQVDQFADDNCTLIIALGHLGIDKEVTPNRSIDVLEHVKGIDVFIDGHSHTFEDQMIMTTVGNSLLVSTGCYGHFLGKLVSDGVTTGVEILPAPQSILTDDEDEDTELFIETANNEVQRKLSVAFAKTKVFLNGERNEIRSHETNLGDLVADAVAYEAEQTTGKKIDGTILNSGGIRASIQIGNVTMNDLKTVLPYRNTISVIEVQGKDILEALESANFNTPEPTSVFPQVSGIVFTIDTAVPFEKGELYPDSIYYAPAKPGSRITIESIGGKPFDPDKIYRIAMSDFMASGGDTYYVFKYSNETAGIDTGIAMEDGIINYISDKLGGVIGGEYAAPQGRITIK